MARSYILGIETSCDETAAAIIDDAGHICANVVLSQLEDHRPFGGVVPEIAARAHVAHIDHLIDKAVSDADLDYGQIDAVAATAGPGLIGGVMVGLATGKALALALDRPFLAINHLEGHALTVRLTHGVAFPYLLLLVSGGHTQILFVRGLGEYHRLGTTIDDAVGEAFDKTAKLMGLPQPGGPAIERLAETGKAEVALPRPLLGRAGCDFSFAGLKTAVRRHWQGPEPPAQADLAAAFQEAIGDCLLDRLQNGLALAQATWDTVPALVLAGGVAANKRLRTRVAAFANAAGVPLIAPPLALCTDNAAMIAWAGLERWQRGERHGLDFPARARWPLDPAAAKRPFAGAKA